MKDAPGGAFDVSYEFDAQGTGISPVEIQAAINRGDGAILKDGQVYLLDADAITRMHDIFSDCATRQNGAVFILTMPVWKNCWASLWYRWMRVKNGGLIGCLLVQQRSRSETAFRICTHAVLPHVRLRPRCLELLRHVNWQRRSAQRKTSKHVRKRRIACFCMLNGGDWCSFCFSVSFCI